MKNGKCLLLGRVKNSEKLSVPRCGISLSRRVESQQEQLENEFNYGKKVKISTLESAKFAFPFGRRSVDERLESVRKLLDKTTQGRAHK